jgi:hypothetical protein
MMWLPLGFIEAFGRRLAGSHVPRRRAQNLLPMIAKRRLIQMRAGADAARESFPFRQDGFDVGQDEISKTHWIPPRSGLPGFGADILPLTRAPERSTADLGPGQQDELSRRLLYPWIERKSTSDARNPKAERPHRS